jgi:hypothetical protein
MTSPPFNLPEEEPSPRPAAPGSSSREEDDDALIRWMLSLTPTQRLEVAQGFVESALILRNGRRA